MLEWKLLVAVRVSQLNLSVCPTDVRNFRPGGMANSVNKFSLSEPLLRDPSFGSTWDMACWRLLSFHVSNSLLGASSSKPDWPVRDNGIQWLRRVFELIVTVCAKDSLTHINPGIDASSILLHSRPCFTGILFCCLGQISSSSPNYFWPIVVHWSCTGFFFTHWEDFLGTNLLPFVDGIGTLMPATPTILDNFIRNTVCSS